MILVLVAGGTANTGPQLIGILVSLCLVTISWLLAPFIFNPYQFRPSCWVNDIKADHLNHLNPLKGLDPLLLGGWRYALEEVGPQIDVIKLYIV